MSLYILFSRLTLALVLGLSSAFADAQWLRVDVNADLLNELYEEDAIFDSENRPGFIDHHGISRFPGCSGGPQTVLGPDGKPTVLPYSGGFTFFIDRGSDMEWSGQLMIYFSGGGACWDPGTCVGSALTDAPTYSATFVETEDILQSASDDLNQNGAGGILTTVRPENPYADFAKVYIPYCTADVHIGTRDTEYYFPELDLSWRIHHRGFDNLLVVLSWLQRQQENNTADFATLTVAGSSAGGYGALANFQVIREAFGEQPRYSIIVDSANGVVTDGFLDRVIGTSATEGVWGVRQNTNFKGVLRSALDLGAESFWMGIFDLIGSTYPDTRISQSTTAYDAVQASVLLNMQRVDDGTYDPFEPSLEQSIVQAALEWSPKARASMLATAFTVPTYRYYLGAGSGHIHLLDPPPEIFPFPTSNYFAEDSARGVKYTDWLNDMLNNPQHYFQTDWRILSCFPRCFQ